MKHLGTHQGRTVYWLDYASWPSADLPKKDWLVFAVCNKAPDSEHFDRFARACIANEIHEFKGFGDQGSLLDDLFDWTTVIMRTMEDHPEIDVMTTWHDDESLASAFWQCFYATCLRETVDLDNVTIVCTDMDGNDLSAELQEYITRFNDGWMPEV